MSSRMSQGASSSGFNKRQDDAAGNYTSFKQESNRRKFSTHQRSASIQSVRILRELSPMGKREDQSKIQAILDYDDVEDEQAKTISLKNEALAGACKSQYTLDYKLKADKNFASFMMKPVSNQFAILTSSLQKNNSNMHRTTTKGQFAMNFSTNAGDWIKNRDEKKAVNPKFWSVG